MSVLTRGSPWNTGGPMLHLEINVKRRHVYTLVAAFAVIMTIVPLASYAADKFNDVPDSNIFHNDIAWLADAGVTKGCNPPANDEFCPGSNVSREQMAAFMRRLAENKVVDAGKLDGLDSTDFAPSDMIGTSIMTASVAPNGTPYGGGLNGPTGVTRTGPGAYTVMFDRDVENCVAATNNLIWISNEDVSASPLNGTSNEIVVKVRNHDDTAYVDIHWSMIVVCPDGAAPAAVESSTINTP
jgi:hypothetical protein